MRAFFKRSPAFFTPDITFMGQLGLLPLDWVLSPLHRYSF
jgi:hypothetical protein